MRAKVTFITFCAWLGAFSVTPDFWLAHLIVGALLGLWLTWWLRETA